MIHAGELNIYQDESMLWKKTDKFYPEYQGELCRDELETHLSDPT
jgi:hypothetical protein